MQIPNPLEYVSSSVDGPPWLEALSGLGIILALALIVNFIVKHIVLRLALRIMPGAGGALLGPVAARIANIAPALVISAGIGLVPHLPEGVVSVTRNVVSAFVILTIALAIGRLFDVGNHLYERRPDAHNKPIKGYVQVGKIVLYGAAVILMVAALFEQSPLLLLSGLGAMAAVLMLVFQDTILSLVASVQLRSNDMLRVGDWIEMPQLNADGDVIDIALHTVKVQNWDKTITTIPTHRLIKESYKNWRGMSESGGRRIKRSLLIDQNSIRFLTSEEVEELRQIGLLKGYLETKTREIESWNAEYSDGRPVNSRRTTNIGTYRAYMLDYLRAHGRISPNMTLIVRQLEPTSKGLPMEIYCFTDTVAWVEYENIQADIFDHLIAILREFHLRIFQEPTGLDLRTALRPPAEAAPEPASEPAGA